MMSKRSALLAPLLFLSATAPALAGGGKKTTAQKAAPKACGITAIPMAIGNSWTYEPVAYPYDQLKIDASKRPRPEDLKMLPSQPQKVVITVKDVQTAKDGSATVSLEEQIDNRTLETSVTCTAAGIVVASPDAFWFAGEPGGGWNLSFDNVDRKDVTFPIEKGEIHSDKNEWHDDFKAHWKRSPTTGVEADLGTGTVELDRHFVYQDDETIAVKAGQYQNAQKYGLETTGRVTVDGDTDAKPDELPQGIVTWYWIADGVGPIEIANSFFHGYQLSAVTLK